jgi:Dolichyl-phosphate-mannose-protein mannosyltransferase
LRVVPAVTQRAAVRLLTANKLFAAALIPALLLRVDAELGYRWQSWFNDSFSYVTSAVTLTLDPTRPSGYAVYLRLLEPFHSYALVTVSQHLMGLLVAVLIYALARHRFGVPAWIAVLATLPVLYDGFEIQLEHLIMADTLFLFLVMAAVTLVLWVPRPPWWACLAAGLLLGLSSVVRSTGLPLLAVFGVYLLIRFLPGVFTAGQPGWASRRALLAGVAAFAISFAVPVVAYEGWYDVQHGEFAMTDSTGIFLYSRVMTFANCSDMRLPADLLSLCTTVPPDKRPVAQAYIWGQATPLDRFPAPKFSPLSNDLAEQFAIKAIQAQPLAYARTVFDDTWRAFAWNRTVFPNSATYDEYLFGYHSLAIPAGGSYGGYPSAEAYYAQGNPLTKVVNPFARAIRVYERYIWLPGTVYGLILLIGLGGMVLVWRRWGGPALLPWGCSLALIVAPAATAEFDYRYVLTAVPFACLAAALAFGSDMPAGRWLALLARGTTPGTPVQGDPSPRTPLEPSGAAGSPGGVAGRGLGHGAVEASDDKRDLAPDTS